MYVTDAWAGVHVSTNGGQTWFPSNEDITTRAGESGDAIPVFCLTIDPHNYDTLWVGTQNVRGIKVRRRRPHLGRNGQGKGTASSSTPVSPFVASPLLRAPPTSPGVPQASPTRRLRSPVGPGLGKGAAAESFL